MTLLHRETQKHSSLIKTKEKSKSQKQISKKVHFDLLHRILGHRSTSSLLDGDTIIVWQDIDIRLDPDQFCTPCQI